METRDLIQTSLLVALCVALGYLMIFVPNLELISAAIFTAGVLTGVRRGVVIGLLAETIYAGFNPMGASAPPLFLAQVVAMAIVGGAGGVFAAVVRTQSWPRQALLAGISGLLLTLFYDVLTNSAVYLSVRESSSWAAVVIGGLSFPFPLAHALGNAVGFALIVPAVRRSLERWSLA
ncbi:MAG: hypothetical protein JSW67_14555 [Candidatus Latescibacterota bacterium]|nr:MAG: hypothetical protein JSW67_14555 [Candidatus Latescibacterota bacterium]